MVLGLGLWIAAHLVVIGFLWGVLRQRRLDDSFFTSESNAIWISPLVVDPTDGKTDTEIMRNDFRTVYLLLTTYLLFTIYLLFTYYLLTIYLLLTYYLLTYLLTTYYLLLTDYLLTTHLLLTYYLLATYYSLTTYLLTTH